MNAGLLILRLVAGLLIAGHGLQKATFWFGGRGLSGGAEEFRHDGFRGGRLTALAAGGGQIGSGVFLIVGALTPMAAMVAIGVMTVAITVKWHNGLWVQNDGYEYPLVLVVLAAMLALTGPGRWSADHLFGLTPWPRWLSVVTVALGLGSGLLTRLILHQSPVAQASVPAGRTAD